MAAGATGGGLSLMGWIAGAAVAAAIGVGGLYFTGYLAPEPVPDAPVQVVQPATESNTGTAPVAREAAAAPPPPAEQPAPQAGAAAEPEPEPQGASAPPSEAQIAETEPQGDPAAPAPDLQAPRFDLVRVDAHGNTVIAGTGTAGARVTIFLDGEEQVSAVVDRGGAFVSLLSVPPSDAARVLSMVAELNGVQKLADDQIILAPTPRAEPETEPETVPQVAQTETVPTGPMIATDETPLAEADTQVVATLQTPATEELPTKVPDDQRATARTASESTGATDTAPAQASAPTSQAAPAQQIATLTPPAQGQPIATGPQVVAQATPEPAPADPPEVVAETEPAESEPATTPAVETPRDDPGQLAEAEPAQVRPIVDAPLADSQTVAGSEPTATDSVTESQGEPTAPVAVANTETSPPAAQEPTTNPVADPGQAQAQAQAAVAVPVTVLRAGTDGVEVLQSGAPVPEVMDKIALDTISYSELGEVQLAGRAQSRSVVRIYIDNKAVGDLVTDETGRWGGKVTGIEPGIYTLRLDELGAGGDVLSRLETPFKREAPEVLRPALEPPVVAQGDTGGATLAPAPLIRAVTVQQGDTLWAISRERYGDGVLYVRVFEANRADIRDPDLIYPGQVFTIPE